MAKIIWNDSYSVGVAEIDRQHQKLIEIINKLDCKDCPSSTIFGAISDLSQYVKEHFSYEESLMEQAKVTDLAEHKKVHREFSQWLDSVKTAYSSGYAESSNIAESVRSYLQEWVVKHILGSDKAYSEQIVSSLNRNN